jgi:CII-binding regulator of phage lambda lysogenization HflD
MAIESPLERTISAVADYVIDIMKYSLEGSSDSDSEDIPEVIPGTPYDSDDVSAATERWCAFLDAPHALERVAADTSKSSLAQIKQLFSDMPLPRNTPGDIAQRDRNVQLASTQASVDALAVRLGDLGHTLERVESKDRINDLASGLSSACSAFASALTPTSAPSTPDLEKGLSRMEDTLLRELSAVQDSVCHTQHELEYAADRNGDKILARVSDVESLLNIRTHDITADLENIPNQVRSELEELFTHLEETVADESANLAEAFGERADELTHDLDVIHTQLKTKIEDESTRLVEEIITRASDIHSDLDVIHKRLEVDVQQVPERVTELVRGELTNLKVAVQTCVGGLRQESRLDRAEREALAKDVREAQKTAAELQVGFNRFHYDWSTHAGNMERRFETHSKVLKELQSRQDGLSAQIRAMRDDARQERRQHRVQISELHSMLIMVLNRLPEPAKKPNEPDWTSL